MKSKLDLYKTHKSEYLTPRQPVMIRTKEAYYLSIEGQGPPGNARFQACIGALYGMAFTIKMTRKFAGKQDYAVCKLEGQYFGDLPALPKRDWKWKLLIRTPDFVNQQDLDAAVATLLKRGKPPEAKEVKLESIAEGECVQMLHVGPYENEKDSISLMRQFAEGRGLALAGPHHEIYISDPRRVPAERLKTILRVPVGGASHCFEEIGDDVALRAGTRNLSAERGAAQSLVLVKTGDHLNCSQTNQGNEAQGTTCSVPWPIVKTPL